MNTYNGIPISEYRLPVLYGLYFVMFLAVLVAALYLLYLLLGERDQKTANRIRKLKSRAAKDKRSAVLLDLEKQKIKKRRKKNRPDTIYNIVLFTVVVCFECVLFVFAVLNPLLDHINKDYVVYTGPIKVDENVRSTYIELEDGTCVRGGTSLTEEDTFGTVVYAKRSKIALGGQK